VPARRDSGHRVYCDADVGRLKLLQRLVDHGERIGNIARLDEAELVERLAKFEQSFNDTPARQLEHTFMVVSEDADALGRTLVSAGVSSAGSVANLNNALDSSHATAAAPCGLIVELDSVAGEEADKVLQIAEQYGSDPVVVVGRYIPGRVARRLEQSGVVILKKPLTAAVLRDMIRSVCAGRGTSRADAGEAPPAPPVFDKPTLKRIASMPSDIDCECPQHLAEIVSSLSTFEAYSATCEDRSEEDARVHAHLRHVTGRARALMEQALAYTLKAEGLNPADL
jgi:DNA-binding transcriptional MerR regulator